MDSRCRVSSLSRLRAKQDRRARSKRRTHRQPNQDWPQDACSALLEGKWRRGYLLYTADEVSHSALYLYPCKRTGRWEDLNVLPATTRSPYSSEAFSHFDLIQDFIYQKAGWLYPLQQISERVTRLSATGKHFPQCKPYSIIRQLVPYINQPGLRLRFLNTQKTINRAQTRRLLPFPR